MRARKPCVRFFFSLLGWKVRFMRCFGRWIDELSNWQIVQLWVKSVGVALIRGRIIPSLAEKCKCDYTRYWLLAVVAYPRPKY